MAKFVIIEQAIHPDHPVHDWHLCLQWGRIEHGRPDRPPQWGYRFIWRGDDTKQRARAPALLNARHDIEKLWAIADAEGWGDHDARNPSMAKPASG